MFRCVVILSLVLVSGIVLFGCDRVRTDQDKMMSDFLKNVPEQALAKLSEKKIYFGHQSVGFDIVNGISDIMKENPQVRLRIMETANPSDFSQPIFGHSSVGQNANPKSKLDGFSEIIESGIGEKVDIAFLKLCFVDILPYTDVEKTFADYRKSMAELKRRFPEVAFIHITVPLTSDEVGVKAWWKRFKDRVKDLIGKTNFYDNTKRNQFNEMMRKEYDGKEPLFDLAKIESTYPDGKELISMKDGKIQYTLIPDYTYDAGHLNQRGRVMVAERLLLFLVQLAP